MNLQLLVNGYCLPVAQLGPDFLLLNTPINHAPTSAIVIMQVDQNERRWNIRLPEGISAESQRVQIAAAA